MTSLFILISMILNLVWWVIVIQAAMSWLFAFDIVNTRNRFVWQIYETLTKLTEPVLRPIRKFIPNINGLDLSPIVVLIGISFIQVVLANNMGMFMR